MNQQPSRTAGDTKGPTIHGEHTYRSQGGHSIHGQPNHTGLPQKQRHIRNSRRKIRQQLTQMKKMQWHIQFSWVKAHVGILGNETADTLAKEAATSTDTPEFYDEVPISVVKSEIEVASVKKLQREWDQSTKGQITKQYFQDIVARLNMELNLTHNFTLMVTGHGNIHSYLHRFRIRGTPTCPCGIQDQRIDHLLFECELLRKERNILKTNILKTGVLPINKSELIRKHFKGFFKFTNDISFDKLTNSDHNGD